MRNPHLPAGRRLGSFLPYLLIALLTLLAWRLRFIQDDAFISFRYAKNLVDGHGLVFNPGERVEGYTNFLWTLLMAAGIRLGVEIVLWSQIAGTLSFASSLLLLYAIARRVFASNGWGTLALLFTGTNYSFTAYATGGLETSLQTALVLLVVHLAIRSGEGASGSRREPVLVAFSLAVAAALFTRLDSAVILFAPAIAVLVRIVSPPAGSGGRRLGELLAAVLPGMLLLLFWFSWKHSYYGDLLPMTFRAKTSGVFGPTMRMGALYFFDFFRSYWLWPQLLLIAVFAKTLWRTPPFGWLLSGSVLWGLYIASVGGDFMEFRMMVPVLPLGTLCVIRVLRSRRRGVAATCALLAIAIFASAYHAKTFVYSRGIESIANLEGHLTRQRWMAIGESLHRAFPDRKDDVTIAITAAGAVPYYSGLETIDMLGLNDPWIARNGVRFQTQPGHARVAPYRYLVERGANLVIGHPVVVPRNLPFELRDGFEPRLFRIFDARVDDLPSSAKLVQMPIDDDFACLLLYLTPSARVDEAIRERGWKVRPVIIEAGSSF
jgi:arabinofuranosyltransferase